jgi:hypothetical protein
LTVSVHSRSSLIWDNNEINLLKRHKNVVLSAFGISLTAQNGIRIFFL